MESSVDTTVVVATIGAFSTIAAALIAVRVKPPVSATSNERPPIGSAVSRTAFYQGRAHRFLKFGGQNCRIEALDGSPSFLAPTHEIFHDQNGTQRITRDSVVL